MNRIMNWRRHIPDHAVTTVPVLAVMVAVHFLLLSNDPVEPDIVASDAAALFYEHWQGPAEQSNFDIDAEMARLDVDDAERDRRIRELLHQRRYAHARTLLLEVAARAVLNDDQQGLGDTLLLLGEVSIHQQELSAAEIYLQEALYLSMSQDDVNSSARSYQLLGQLNIRARELARRAANTYDQLWQARNAIARGRYRGVNESLQAVIAENLEIRRYGAAADAWEALASLHDKVHDAYQAQQARFEAARLYASTGQIRRSQRLLRNVDPGLISASDLAAVDTELKQLFEQHQQDIMRTSQARDYKMMYHHYLRRGEVERAWKFRVESSKALANASDRALYQRQADVIAVLYNSNFAMERARKYLEQADSIYQDSGSAEMLEQTNEMKGLIY